MPSWLVVGILFCERSLSWGEFALMANSGLQIACSVAAYHLGFKRAAAKQPAPIDRSSTWGKL